MVDILVGDDLAELPSFYGGADRLNAIEQVLHAVRYTESAVVICGPEAAGKTTIINQVMQQSDELVRCVYIAADVMTDLVSIQSALMADSSGADYSESDIEAWLVDQQRESVTIALLLDDADVLHPDTLKSLADWVGRHDVLALGLAISSVTSLAKLLDGHDYFKEATVITLPPLDDEQAGEFVLQLYATLTGRSAQELTASMLEGLVRSADGWPGVLVSAVRQIKAPLPAPVKSWSLPFPPLHIISITIIGVLLLAVLVLPVGQGDILENDSEVVDSESVLEERSSDAVLTFRQRLEQAERENLTSGVVEDVVVEAPPPSVELPVSVAPVSTEEDSEPVLGEMDAHDGSSPSVAPATVSDESADGWRVHDAAWLLSRPPTEYTVQVTGLRSRDAVVAFLEQVHLSKSAWYTSQFKGQPWFVGVVGAYRSREEASAAIASMPAIIQSQGAFVRSIESIQGGLQ